MKFRPDIEGLRALAIVPVVLFHAWPQLLPGGYVGVDIFFVISGYLITTLLLQRLQEGRYGIGAFYAARIRRIFPALFAMLLLTLPLALWLLSPQALAEHARLLGATGLFVSNLELYRSTDYFGTAAELKPLVHTWSLAVEEQYYIVFPLLLAALWRWARRSIPWVLAGIGLLSLAYSQWLLRWDAPLAFYSALSRSFELMIGSWLAWRVHQEALDQARPLAERWRRWAAWLGLAGVVAALLLLHPQSRFPGALALLPCVGTALLIYGGGAQGGAVRALLSSRPLRWIGALSFSLYLWHWPALVFSRHWLLDHPDALQAGVAVLAAVALAWASLRWVEAPVRQARRISERQLLVAGGLSIGLTLSGAWLLLRWAEATPWPPASQALLAASQDASADRPSCHGRDRQPVEYLQRCVRGELDAPREVAVWGDSHAVELADAMGSAGPPGWRVSQLSASACPPAQGFSLPSLADCRRQNRAVLDGLVADARVTHVVVALRFESYLGGHHEPSLQQGLDESLAALRRAGKQVLLVAPVPT